VLTLTRDASTATADENSGDTATLQRGGTTLRNDPIAAIAHPDPPTDPAGWGNAMTASMLAGQFFADGNTTKDQTFAQVAQADFQQFLNSLPPSYS
jgi:hypothetical protein